MKNNTVARLQKDFSIFFLIFWKFQKGQIWVLPLQFLPMVFLKCSKSKLTSGSDTFGFICTFLFFEPFGLPGPRLMMVDVSKFLDELNVSSSLSS